MKHSPLLALAGGLLASNAAHAGDGGYFSGTKGARAAGRGGAFTAKADDLSAVSLNPAGLARIGTTMIQVGNRFSHNAHSFTRAPTLDWGNPRGGVPPYVEFDTVHNATPWQALEPMLGVATNFGLKDWGFALRAQAPPGSARVEFPVDGGQNYMMVRREAIILDYTASVAWKFRDTFGIGASLQWIHVPRLEYQVVIDANQFPGEANPVSSELDMLATVSGSDPFTFNGILGAWYRPAPFFEVAASAQIVPAKIVTSSTLSVEPLSEEIDEEVVLRRDGEMANDVSLTLPLPLTAQIGVRYIHQRQGREVFDVELDVGYASWSRVDKFVVDGDGLVAELLAQQIDVGLIEIDKQWRDTASVRLGADYHALPDRLTLRGGAYYLSNVADRAYAHVDFVSGQQVGGAVGASVLFKGAEIALTYGYRHQPTVRVPGDEAAVYQETPGSQCQPPYTDPDNCHPQYLGQPAPAVNAGTYRAASHVASLDVLYRF